MINSMSLSFHVCVYSVLPLCLVRTSRLGACLRTFVTIFLMPIEVKFPRNLGATAFAPKLFGPRASYTGGLHVDLGRKKTEMGEKALRELRRLILLIVLDTYSVQPVVSSGERMLGGCETCSTNSGEMLIIESHNTLYFAILVPKCDGIT